MQINYNYISNKIARNDIKEYKKLYPKLGKINILEIISLGGLIFVFFAFCFINISSQLDFLNPKYTLYYLLPVSVILTIVLIRVFQGRYNLIKNLRLDKFSASNNFAYIPIVQKPEESGTMFNIMYDHFSYDVIRSKSKRFFEIGNHEYDSGSNENQNGIKTFQFGYIKIQLDRNLPHIVLDSKRNNSSLPVSFKENQVLSLEGDFDSSFTLYAPKNYERDALYIFSPDLMSLFIDELGCYDAEIIDNNLFIYSKKPLKLLDQNTLRRIFNIIDVVGNKTISQTNNYSDGNVAARSMNFVAEAGSRLKKRISNSAIFLIIVFIIVFGFNILIQFIPSVVKLFMK